MGLDVEYVYFRMKKVIISPITTTKKREQKKNKNGGKPVHKSDLISERKKKAYMYVGKYRTLHQLRENIKNEKG